MIVSGYLFRWTLLNGPIAMPNGDGYEGAVLNGALYSVGGWLPTGVSINRVFRTQSPPNFVESAQPPSFTGRHWFPLVVHGDRMHVIGGDKDDGNYEPNWHSWDGLEASPWRVDMQNVPILNRVGHIGFSNPIRDEIVFGLGQTLPTEGAATEMFTDLYRTRDGSDGSITQITDSSALGARAFCGNPVILDGEALFVAGGAYQTPDFPYRLFRGDIMGMSLDDYSVRCINPRSQLPPMLYPATCGIGGKALVIAGGVAADNIRRVFVSFDKGDTLTELETPPWAATHGATLVEYNGAAYLWGGLATGQICYRLDMIDVTKIHCGPPADMVTNLNSVYTVFDRSIALPPGKTVRWIGMSCARAHAGMRPKIGRELAPTLFDVPVSGAAGDHPGGGYNDFEIPPFTVPDDGYTYRIGMSFTYAGASPDNYAGTGIGRAMAPGDVGGAGLTFSAPSDGTFPMRWIEA